MQIVSGNIYLRTNGPFPAGHVVCGHEHTFDHTTICFAGAMRVSCAGHDVTIMSPRVGYEGPSHVLVAAGVKHEITVLEPGTIFWCVYAHRNAQGEVVQTYEGLDDAYGTWLTAAKE